jgi:glycosyltransferase involved in cell wall biosynthesis
MLKISLIIPVYNRPGEIEELLGSLVRQTDGDFEVLIVEDGSTLTSQSVAEAHMEQLEIRYFTKPNSGPGPSRNFGAERAGGDYLIFLDSDCVIPPQYVETVRMELTEHPADAFGGPDEAHADFTRLQKAINFSMTSLFTTGGIRGGTERLGKFHPRSFNMGYSREVHRATGGFAEMRFGEDVDLSIRILGLGFTTRLIREAYVYHKRRTSLRQFFKQVYNSGIARINLHKRHPGSLKAVHLAPSAFTLGALALVVLSLLVSAHFIWPLLLHLLLLFVTATIKNRSLAIGLLAVVTSYTQLVGYGSGFMVACWRRLVLGRDEFAAFTRNFYK